PAIIPTLAALLLLAVPGAWTQAAPKRERRIDHFKTYPDLRSIRLTAVAMLPAVSFEGVGPAERHAEAELMRGIRDAGYRWITGPTTREMLRRAGGDSLLKAVREAILSRDRIDSLMVPRLCGLLRVNGLITVRVDRADQISIQSDQTGRPSTSVQVRAVLVDSLGRLVWSASGSEHAEGLELQSDVGGVVGGGSSNLTPTATQARNNAPDWPLVLQPMILRWAPTFPRRAAMAGGAPADSTSR
ncbi:MAG: hypothetical protein ABIS67_01945, partial [Candidatus Eisenbacteria bacterium]